MQTPAPDAIGLFLDVAGADPHRIAIRHRQVCVTYAELERLVRQYAALFTTHESPRVLIALPRGCHAYACMLAAGLAGGLYSTVNVASPPARLQRVARLFEPHVIVAAEGLSATLAQAAPAARAVSGAELDAAKPMAGPGDRHAIAYVMFTSGSTGEPKGVVVPRTGLNHYVRWIGQSGTIGREDVVSQFNNLAFDVSVLDVYGALCTGAVLVPIEGRGARLRPARIVASERITVWTSVPSAIELMQVAGQLTAANLGTVRLFTLAGEPLTRPHLQAIFTACPRATVQNAYGPTEATVTVSRMVLRAETYQDACLGDAVSIGPAIPGMELRLEGGAHDDEGQVVISGPQVALGYWNDPERTRSAFRLTDSDGGVSSYCTGDWAERHRGLLFFRGRIDTQVKVRGYRVELDEVAGAVRACGWPTVCVFKTGDELTVLVEDVPGVVFDAEAIRRSLASRLEPYAVPARIAATPRLPRNENDKIDVVGAAASFTGLA